MAGPVAGPVAGPAVRIVDPGPFCTVQDLGRPGYAELAVPCSGAFDRGALRLANRLVGNAEGAAGLEFVLGGLHLLAARAVTVALTGAPCPGGPAWGAAVTLPAGRRLRLGTPSSGLRSYLAVRGGLDVTPVLGARCHDTLSGLGPPPVRAGDGFAVGTAVDADVPGLDAPVGRAPSLRALQVLLGPRDDWFTAAGVDALFTTTWTVRSDSDRVGVRLAGPALERSVTGELPSEAALPGAVQVPADGRPILFGPDSPVTGGYPVIAVLRAGELDRAGQLRPGDTVRLRQATAD